MNSPARAHRKLPDAARTVIPFLPAAATAVTWITLMPADGGYFARDWAPAGMIVCGLWLVAVVGGGRLVPPGTSVRVALGALSALALLAFLSTTWADAPATAFSTASQFLTVVLGAWTLALAPWRAGPAHLLAAGLAAGAAFA